MLTKVEAAPWPYLPADLLPIFIALGVRSSGQVMFRNKVCEGALTWRTELALFGAHTLLCDPHRLITFGGKPLVVAMGTSPYIIRIAIALFMVAAATPGESIILDADPIRRAHPGFVENLVGLGADVDWFRSEQALSAHPTSKILRHDNCFLSAVCLAQCTRFSSNDRALARRSQSVAGGGGRGAVRLALHGSALPCPANAP